MNPLKHSKKTKQQIEKALYDFLYARLLNVYKTRLEILIKRNSLTMNSSHSAFDYGGKTYSSETRHFPHGAVKLAEEHHKEMDEYLAELEELKGKEVPHVLGFINQVVNATNALQDLLNVFPASVHHPIQSYIDTCPCRTKYLCDTDVASLIKKNGLAISLIKERLLTNLHQRNLAEAK